MRFGIVSDIHLGDDACSLMTRKNGQAVLEDKYAKFKKYVGTDNDYLIVAGDIIDLSISDYSTAFAVAQAFFKQIQKDGLAKNIIYLVGNHDFDLWHTVEYQINIIHQIHEGKPARRFTWSAPGLIDDRTGSPTRGFQLPRVTGLVDPDNFSGVPLFINSITTDGPGAGKATNFYFAYPNLYVVTDDESIIVTHGHYLEVYWSITCEWAKKIAGNDLRIQQPPDLKDAVAVNSPTCQLACSGVGQAGPLTMLVQKIQHDVKNKNLDKINEYIDNFDNEVDEMVGGNFITELASDMCINAVKKQLKKALAEFKDTRYDDKFLDDDKVQDRFRRFYDSSMAEISGLNDDPTLNIPEIPMPSKVIFGHTHRPVGLDAQEPPHIHDRGKSGVTLYNTGGWLYRKPKDKPREFCGAEIFKYETGAGLSSLRVA